MLEFIIAGGVVMYPIILCSIVALAIVVERLWVLRASRISPRSLMTQVRSWMKSSQLDGKKVKELRDSSPLGRVLATGLLNARHGRDIMKESIVETATHEIHEMGRFLNLLGTIATISPLLGLLGTVMGMVHVFSTIVLHGSADPALFAGGIAEALYTTVAGLLVAIPALFFHRFFCRRIDELSVLMEQDAIRLVDIIHGERESENGEGSKA